LGFHNIGQLEVLNERMKRLEAAVESLQDMEEDEE
jgi:hypothetical protein